MKRWIVLTVVAMVISAPSEIQGFNVSDGYNLLLYNLPQIWGGIEARIGLGVVIGHPDGYYIGTLGDPG